MDDDIAREFEDAMRPADFADDDRTQAWQPRDENAVDWCLLKRANALARIERINVAKAAALYELAALYDRRITAERATADYFELTAIDALARIAEPDKRGKRSLKLPHGTVYEVAREHIAWPDDDALVGWCTAHLPMARKVKYAPDKAALKAHMKATGEVPDGVEVGTVTTIQIREA